MRAIWTLLRRIGAGIGSRRAEHFLTQLDERTIRDVGLEGWRSPLGAEVEHRRHLARRWQIAARFGWF